MLLDLKNAFCLDFYKYKFYMQLLVSKSVIIKLELNNKITRKET